MIETGNGDFDPLDQGPPIWWVHHPGQMRDMLRAAQNQADITGNEQRIAQKDDNDAWKVVDIVSANPDKHRALGFGRAGRARYSTGLPGHAD